MSAGVDIKLKDLRYLVAVADTRHFGRAADKCFVSQPTLSAQLKKLEDYLGVQLIERQPKNVTLTEAGEQIVARARRILEASEEVVTLARAHRDPLAGRLRLALLPTIGPYLLPRVSQPMRKALPRLELRLYEYQTAQMLEKIEAGDIDHLAVAGMHARAIKRGGKAFGAATENLVDDLSGAVGNTGTAHPALLLTSTLEQAGNLSSQASGNATAAAANAAPGAGAAPR